MVIILDDDVDSYKKKKPKRTSKKVTEQKRKSKIQSTEKVQRKTRCIPIRASEQSSTLSHKASVAQKPGSHREMKEKAKQRKYDCLSKEKLTRRKPQFSSEFSPTNDKAEYNGCESNDYTDSNSRNSPRNEVPINQMRGRSGVLLSSASEALSANDDSFGLTTTTATRTRGLDFVPYNSVRENDSIAASASSWTLNPRITCSDVDTTTESSQLVPNAKQRNNWSYSWFDMPTRSSPVITNEERTVRAGLQTNEIESVGSVVPRGLVNNQTSSMSQFIAQQPGKTNMRPPGNNIIEQSLQCASTTPTPPELLNSPPSESRQLVADPDIQVAASDSVIKLFQPVDPQSDDLLIEEVDDEKKDDLSTMPGSEETSFCQNFLIPNLKKLNNERKSFAKLEIHRILHNIEFQAVIPSLFGSNQGHSFSQHYNTMSTDEDERFCFTLIIPTLDRLDEERKSLAILEIQRVLHSVRFRSLLCAEQLQPPL